MQSLPLGPASWRLWPFISSRLETRTSPETAVVRRVRPRKPRRVRSICAPWRTRSTPSVTGDADARPTRRPVHPEPGKSWSTAPPSTHSRGRGGGRAGPRPARRRGPASQAGLRSFVPMRAQYRGAVDLADCNLQPIQETAAAEGFFGERGGTRTLDPMIKSYMQGSYCALLPSYYPLKSLHELHCQIAMLSYLLLSTLQSNCNPIAKS